MQYLLKITLILIHGKTKFKKLQSQPSKQFIISKNNFRLSKEYSLINRAQKILKVIKN